MPALPRPSTLTRPHALWHAALHPCPCPARLRHSERRWYSASFHRRLSLKEQSCPTACTLCALPKIREERSVGSRDAGRCAQILGAASYLSRSCTLTTMSKFLWNKRPPPGEEPPVEDCLECKLVGSGSMFALSGYFVYLNHTATKPNLSSPRLNLVMAACFAAAGIARVFV